MGTRPEPSRPSYVLPETTVLAVLGCADLLTSVYLIGSHIAWEANPLMGRILDVHGPWAFALAKAALLAGPLAIAEVARRRHPGFVRAALRVAIAVYAAAMLFALVGLAGRLA